VRPPPLTYLIAAAVRIAARIAVLAVALLLAWMGHIAWALALVALAAGVIAYLTLSPTTRYLGPVMTSLPKGCQGVLLTFDDGPDPITTLPLLDLLDQRGVKALFFLIGDRVQQWPELAREIQRRGHALGNHTQRHLSGRFWSLGPMGTWREIAEAQHTLSEVLGLEVAWFRAPVGHYQGYTHPALRSLNLKLVAWSSRGFDGISRDVSRILQHIEKTLAPGAIVLLHEGRSSTLEVTQRTLESMATRGLQAVSADALRE
jgi:peptidoglycan-N-acetylglucosamine deacetylase